jgi:PKD repeat protein
MGTFSNEYYGGGKPNFIRAVNPAYFIDVQTSCVNSPVAFRAKVPIGIQSYLWHFGDGHTSTEAEPSHIYEKSGKYTVTLEIQKTDHSTENISKEIEILEKPLKPVIVKSSN